VILFMKSLKFAARLDADLVRYPPGTGRKRTENPPNKREK
jgi:hypothetical protein